MEKPIRIRKYTALSKEWDLVVGFLASWFQDEMGFTQQQLFTRDRLFNAEPTAGGHFHEILCLGPDGDEPKVMSDGLYQALLEYSCLRSWRLPQNEEFFVGALGAPFSPKDYRRYAQN